MLLADLPRLLLRRWPVLVLGAVVCVLLGTQAAQDSPPRKAMTASTVLLPPAARESTGPNPYLALGGLEGAADVVARRVVSDQLEADLAEAGVESFEVVRDAGSPAPIVVTTVVAPSTDAAEDGIDVLVEAVPLALGELQSAAGVEEADLITTRVLSAPAEPEVMRTPQIRAVLLRVAAGGLLTLLAAVLLDLVLARSRRRDAAAAAVREEIVARAAARREDRDRALLLREQERSRNGSRPERQQAGTGS